MKSNAYINQVDYSGTVLSLYKLIKTVDMKQIFKYAFIASFMIACNTKSDLDANKNVILTDTTGMYNSNMMTDTGSVIETSAVTNGTRNSAVANHTHNNTSRANSSRTHSNSNTSGSTARSSGSGTSTGHTTTTQKRGWSKAAKGAVIGGASGAVVGAVVSKKKGKGAAIGGVVGAAGGYILGRSKDKRDGRVQ